MIRRMEPTVRIPSATPSHVRVPPELEGLRRLAYNLYWTWHPKARALFARISSAGWARSHSPMPILTGMVDWAGLLDNPDFMAEAYRVVGDFDRYMANGADHWFHRKHARELKGPIAYFCAEYGLHETLGIYSGGLGVLAGDHMKAASDMALPLVGVGLLYRNGYFRQTIDADGHQEHRYPDYDLARLPITRALGREGDPLTVTVELPGRDIKVDVWTVQVGRVPVLLLDTDNPVNDPADRPITNILYVRGREMRLHQELILGVGGVRALRALGIAPAVWHLNEGHSAFLLAERARELVAGGASLDDALATVSRNSVFSIHTPVSAGQRALRRRPRPPDRRPAPRRRRASQHRRGAGRASAGDRARHGRRPRTVRHDRVQPAPDQRRERGEPAPRDHRQRHVAGHRAARDPADHERRAPADLGRRPGPRAVRALPRRRPRRPRRVRRTRPAGGTGSSASRRPSCGRRTSARSASSRSSPGAGCGPSSPGTARPRAPSRSSAGRSTRGS